MFSYNITSIYAVQFHFARTLHDMPFGCDISNLCVAFFCRGILHQSYTGLVICWVVMADNMKVGCLVMVAQAGSGSEATAAMLIQQAANLGKKRSCCIQPKQKQPHCRRKFVEMYESHGV